MRRIAVLTDRVDIASGLRQALAPFDLELVWHRDQSGILQERAVDAVLASGRDPVDMTALIRRVTASPLLVVGGDEGQAATCLDLGADAWLPEATPAGVIAAQLRRLLETRRGAANPDPVLIAGPLAIDTGERRATLDRRELQLAPREYELLRVMVENRGKAISRDRILAAAWGPRFVGEPKTVDVHIAWLRQKLDGSGLRLTTIRGLGYRLDLIPVASAAEPATAAGERGRSTMIGP